MIWGLQFTVQQSECDTARQRRHLVSFRFVPSVVAEASIGVASSAAIVFCRLEGGVEEGMLNGWLELEGRTRI